MAANDLCELYENAVDVREDIDLLLKTPSSDFNKLQDIFVELDVTLWHMKDHLINSRKALKYLAEYCDKYLPQDE